MKTNKFYYWLLTISAVVLLFNSTQLSAQTCTPPPAGMVAWFPGDGNANDIQDGNNGTINGGVTFTSGKVSQAFNFDGTGDVTYPTINAGSAYTLDFWMRPTLAGVNQHVISNIANSANYGSLRFVNDHVEYLQSGAFQVVSPAGSVPLNTYTHIALTYDGSVNRLYINGSLTATSGVHTETFNNQLSLGFAIINNYGESRFNGQIDEVEIFNRALLQTEIQAIVAADSAGKCKPPVTFVVNTTTDTNDGVCNTTHCSLREAIIAANANPVTSQPDRIEFNIPGAGVQTINVNSTGLGALPTITDPVVIDGYTQPNASVNTATDGSTNAVLLIEINGSAAPINSNGLTIAANGNTVRGLIINRFQSNVNGDVNAGSGIGITSNSNVVEGNFLGTDSSGTADLGNANHGIFVSGGLNRIGGTTLAARNLISGNGAGNTSFSGSGAAVIITGGTATQNSIEGNLIGTDKTGTLSVANLFGVFIFDSATNNLIGGTTVGARNVISGNSLRGIVLGSSSTVQGNYIGVTANGSTALGNGFDGIVSGDGNTIGGTSAAARNVISGNPRYGISLIFGNQTIVQGNFIGTDAAGTGNLGNGSTGIIISGNSNTIGGTTAGAGNTIAFNGDVGVFAFRNGVTANRILGNSIFSNVGIGIDLQDAATTSNVVTANDPGDADTGANNLQNYPVLSSAMSGASAATVQGTFNSMPSMTFRVEFFSNPACDSSGFGEGQTFIGFQSVTTDASGNATVNFTSSGAVATGQFITSTATDPNGNTSEFSACRQVLAPTAASVSIGGRVTTSKGIGISGVRVSITNSNGETHIVLTNSLGYYFFDKAEAGQTYILSASHKRYYFTQPTRVVSVSEELTDLDFTALPLQRVRQM